MRASKLFACALLALSGCTMPGPPATQPPYYLAREVDEDIHRKHEQSLAENPLFWIMAGNMFANQRLNKTSSIAAPRSRAVAISKPAKYKPPARSAARMRTR